MLQRHHKAMSDFAEQEQMQRFNALAAVWWNTHGPMWPLHRMNEFRVQLILQHLQNTPLIQADSKRPLSNLSVLDIGCGGGILSESLAKLGAKVTAIDVAENNIRIAIDHAKKSNLDIDYRCSGVETITDEYDLVFNMEVVEHVANPEAFIHQCNQLVRNNGFTFVSTINRTLMSYLFAIIGAEYVMRLLPKGTHQWNKFVKPDELCKWLQLDDFLLTWKKGIALNPFSQTFKLKNSLSVNYIIAARKMNSGIS